MIDAKVIDRIDRLIETSFHVRNDDLKKEISRIMHEMNCQGNLFSSATIKRIIDTYQHELKVRVEIVYRIFLRVHQIFESSFTDTLCDNFKNIFYDKIEYILNVLKDLSENDFPKIGSDNKKYLRMLDDTKEYIVHKYDIEFDLYFDKIKNLKIVKKITMGR